MSAYFSLSNILVRLSVIQGDRLATIYGERKHTWAELQDRVTRLAGGLVGLGIKKMDIVAVLAENSDRYFEIYFSPNWIGSVLAPLNNRWSSKENLHVLQDSGAKVLFFDSTFIKIAEQLKDSDDHSLAHFIYIGEGDCPSWAHDYETIILENMPAVQFQPKGDDMALLMYTGGTTGSPKGVMVSHMGMWSCYVSLVHHAKYNEHDRYLHAAPMFHGADLGISIATVIAGATQVFINHFTVDGVLEAIANHRVTQILLVPTMVKMLLSGGKVATTDVSSLKQLIYGASPMAEGVLLECMKQLPKVDLIQAYGQTELSLLASTLSPSDHTPGNKRLRSAGRPCLCVTMRVEDEAGNILPSGEVGQVMVHGPNVMLGYWNKPELTAETLKDGWIGTGDAGYLDTDGYLYLVDRIKDMIVSGGENVFSAEVESIISLYPAVADVVVIGIPDEEWGEAVHALIILKKDKTATEEEIINHCKEYIAGYKCPRCVDFHTEPFPVSAAGKTLKADIRKLFWPEGERHIN